jgi:hypothetical protein
MTRDELAACQERHRSPIVLQCVDDYLAGKRTAAGPALHPLFRLRGGLSIQPD